MKPVASDVSLRPPKAVNVPSGTLFVHTVDDTDKSGATLGIWIGNSPDVISSLSHYKSIVSVASLVSPSFPVLSFLPLQSLLLHPLFQLSSENVG